jgi:PTH1 family peptidyl-tRNA hydrolase
VKLVVGLGNPGREYVATRHNVGCRVVERLAERHAISLGSRKFSGRFGRGRIASADVGLLLPETFMNLSGESVTEALRLLPVGDVADDLFIVFDDVDLPFGRIRLRPSGRAGGHRGLGDVLRRLGREDVPRLRFGVGRPAHPGMSTADFVLQAFAKDEEARLASRLDDAAHAIETVFTDGLRIAMDRFNRPDEPICSGPPDRQIS